MQTIEIGDDWSDPKLFWMNSVSIFEKIFELSDEISDLFVIPFGSVVIMMSRDPLFNRGWS